MAWTRKAAVWAVTGVLASAVAAGVPGSASAQAQGAMSDMDIEDMLEGRMRPEDARLIETLHEKNDRKETQPADADAVYERGIAYFREADYYSARRLFGAGLVAYSQMKWPWDQLYALIFGYERMSQYFFCKTSLAHCVAVTRNFGDMMDMFVGLEEAERAAYGQYAAITAMGEAGFGSDFPWALLPEHEREPMREGCRAARADYGLLLGAQPAATELRLQNGARLIGSAEEAFRCEG